MFFFSFFCFPYLDYNEFAHQALDLHVLDASAVKENSPSQLLLPRLIPGEGSTV